VREAWRTATLAVIVAGAVLAAALHSPERLLTVAENAAADPLLFAGVVVGLYAIRPFVLWPPTLVAVVVGYGFGVMAGFPIALAGAVGTAVVPYVLAARFGREAPLVGRLQTAGEGFFEATGSFRGVVAARLAPIPADAVTVAAAIAGVRFRTFAAGVLVGETPWTLGAVAVGASLSTLSTEGASTGGLRITALATVAAIALLAGPAYRRYSDGRSGTSAPWRS